ncbi:LIM and SH3 domain protein 1-like [Anneissia japonica]|uniref:LIM and SH3 domain protein 1-like n=1 Tax=Anneissia japonica TaxID=1529436 RepID=UPI00142586B9|nr:LIM and SH3 domain protein 1-like [Anneissia japonica]
MNPPCARCNKTVYPMEKMSVLDKVWHKGCFQCETCGLKLTLKTYKGYSKKPYCNTHYPTTKFTQVADTPENKRLAQQSKNQSQISYTSQSKKAVPLPSSPSSAPPPIRGYQPPEPAYPQPPREPDPVPYQQPLPSIVHEPLPPVPPQSSNQAKYQALYDYAAADDDEVSFAEGDYIIEVTVIDDGWMEGRVQRTGQYGMLPSNYVEKV